MVYEISYRDFFRFINISYLGKKYAWNKTKYILLEKMCVCVDGLVGRATEKMVQWGRYQRKNLHNILLTNPNVNPGFTFCSSF